MILRGFCVENWRCIRKFSLPELAPGIVILHGPNRTGKSSLVKALRACLFDFDHDTAAQAVQECMPWDGSGPPKIIVDFTVGRVDYRLTKVFSRAKEGRAALEKKVDSQWKLEQSGREASRRTRELLGADKSRAGLNQLLWLDQGEIGLPEAKIFDATLQQKLAGVLGAMVTGPDVLFKKKLDQLYHKWYTPQTGRFKQDSGVARLESEISKRRLAWEVEKKKFDACEAALKQLQDADDDLPRKKQDVALALKEQAQLQEVRQRCQDRVKKFREAQQAVQDAKQRLADAQTAVDKRRSAAQRLQDETTKLRTIQESAKNLQQQRDRLADEHRIKTSELATARLTENDHRRRADDLDDLRKLVEVADRKCLLAGILESLQSKAGEIDVLESRLKSLAAPGEKQLRDLRDNRDKALKLRAHLEASGLTVTITPTKFLQVELALDGQPGIPVRLPASQQQSWTLRQHARIALPDIGLIELARAQQNVDLDAAAAELGTLDRKYTDDVLSFQENPVDTACLDRLLQRLHNVRAWSDQLAKLRQEFLKLAPKGRGAAEAENAALDQQRQVILQRRPDVANWRAARDDIDECERQYRDQSSKLEKQRESCEAAEAVVSASLKKANDSLQHGKEELAAATAKELAARDELSRLGDEDVLNATLGQAKAAWATAEQVLTDSRLTEDELNIDQRCTEAGTALEERKKRCRSVEDNLTNLRGFLQGNEGLHTRLADAEAAMLHAEHALAREQLEAAAHKRLHDLFDQCREKQVQQVMQPISSRVLEWSRAIGLGDVQDVRFGDRFLLEGITLSSRRDDAPAPLDSESYGTSEQLSLLVRLALGGILANDEPVVAILDDPLAHADPGKHRRILDILRLAADGCQSVPPAGRLQIVILTCHPDRFDHLPGAQHVDLSRLS